MQSTQSFPQMGGGRKTTFKERSRTSVSVIVTSFSVALDAAYSALGCAALRDTMPAASREVVSA